MKLLFDQNISHKLCERLQSLYQGSRHLREVELERSSDENVWQYAKEHDFVIVSKDSDFHQRSFVFGAPPKTVWIRKGNCSTSDIERVLNDKASLIDNFYKDSHASFLILD